MRCLSDVPLVIHLLCGLGMISGMALLIIGTIVRNSGRGKFLMFFGVVSCVVAVLLWDSILGGFVTACR